jgi:hypothetical protein
MPFCIPSTDIPNGMCTDLCTTACATGATCLKAPSAATGTCYKSCTTPGSKTQCRSDGKLVCDDWSSGAGTMDICYPICTLAADCGTAANVRCNIDGRCCGIPGYACCSTGTACVDTAGATTTCGTSGYCP